MFSVRLVLWATVLTSMLGLAGCGDITDDLFPDSSDRRPDVEAGTDGVQVSQQSPNFFLSDSEDVSRDLYDELVTGATTGVVLYFTMWCPICDAHMSHMRENVIPNFPNVSFFLVDYVSGSISNTRAAQISSGYAGITTLADVDQTVFNLYKASMGTTIVIDSVGNIVRMNEDYKDGVKLIEILQALP